MGCSSEEEVALSVLAAEHWLDSADSRSLFHDRQVAAAEMA